MSHSRCVFGAATVAVALFIVMIAGCRQPNEAAKDTPANHSAAAEPAAKPKPTTDGVWKIQSAMLGGEAMPSAATENMTLKLTGEDYLVTVGDVPDQGTCTLDQSVIPNRMTIKGTEGPNTGKTMLAIYEMPDNATLRVCYDLKGSAFPSAFTSTPENQWYLVTYVRKP